LNSKGRGFCEGGKPANEWKEFLRKTNIKGEHFDDEYDWESAIIYECGEE
jgi:hypothetical protein